MGSTADGVVARRRRTFSDVRSMTVSRQRVIYASLLGRPAVRQIGAMTIYYAPDTPFQIRSGDNPVELQRVAAVLPNVAHEIRSPDREIGVMLIEPETIAPFHAEQLARQLSTDHDAMHCRFSDAFETWLRIGHGRLLDTASIDRLFLGRALEPRRLDRRVDMAVRQVAVHPWKRHAASEQAEHAGISFDHFVHIFKREIGMPFRAFCAWKRARSVLPFVARDPNLTDLAHKIGYPDSTHFSHSIKRIYGLRPSEIIQGSRRLSVRNAPAGLVLDAA